MGLDTVELVMAVEDHFGISIPDEVAAKLDTVGLLHEFNCAEQARLGRNFKTRQQLFEELVVLVSKHSGVNASLIHADSSFVKDLRMD